jgi:alpha-tubulin suppressor-like RCC1 family protein
LSLGLGSIPLLQQVAAGRSRRSTSTKKMARYQLRPSVIPGIGGTELPDGLKAMRVSCGEGHALCVLNCGAVLAWGRNNCGQLGTGTTLNGFLCDSFSPILLPPFLSSKHEKLDSKLTALFSSANPSTRYSRIMEQLLHTDGTPAKYKGGRISAMDVVCGAFHSLCLDSEGNVWSWGARGTVKINQCRNSLC